RVGARRIDLQEAIVVQESTLSGGEVEKDLAPLTAACGFQMVGEPVLEPQQPLWIESGPLNRDGIELAAPREGVVDVVDDAGQHEPVHCRWRAHLCDCATAAEQFDPTESERGRADRAESEQIASIHDYTMPFGRAVTAICCHRRL